MSEEKIPNSLGNSIIEMDKLITDVIKYYVPSSNMSPEKLHTLKGVMDTRLSYILAQKQYFTDDGYLDSMIEVGCGGNCRCGNNA